MDVCITPSKRYKDMFLIATTDFFHPLTDDPYLMGQIACANVLSDMCVACTCLLTFGLLIHSELSVTRAEVIQ